MDSDDPSKLGLAEKSKKRASLLAEFLFSPCPIRAANAPVLASLHPCSSGESVVEGYSLL